MSCDTILISLKKKIGRLHGSSNPLFLEAPRLDLSYQGGSELPGEATVSAFSNPIKEKRLDDCMDPQIFKFSIPIP